MMKTFSLQQIVRENIWNLTPYSSARDEYKGTADVFLDANENPFGTLNRYPDPYQKTIKEKLSALKKVSQEELFVGNGSDEVIDLAYRIFCEPGKDKALTFTPTYGMYDVSAEINNIELLKVPLTDDFQLPITELNTHLQDETLKLIFLCSPNNPTGNLLASEDIEYVLQNFNGIVIIDEAYIDFSSEPSFIKKIKTYPNLIVSQTFSKAWGLAGVRVGVAYANEAIIKLYNNVKPPYNVSALNQQAVEDALDNYAEVLQNINIILLEKERLYTELEQLPIVKKIYPSEANFYLVEVTDANGIYRYLTENKIIIRNRHNIKTNCVRITIGNQKENQELINQLNVSN